MAAANAHLLGRARLLAGAGLIATPMAVYAQNTLHPHQQWVCEPIDGSWQCRIEAMAPGLYPQAPKPEQFLTGKQPIASATAPSPTVTPKATSRSLQPEQWDWVPVASLTEAQRCELPAGCRGSYIEPARDWEEADADPATAPLRASADTTDVVGDTATLSGNIRLTKGSLSASGNNAEYNRKTGDAIFEGNVTLRQPGLLMRGSRAEFNTTDKTGHVDNALFVAHESGARGTASRVARPSEQVLTLSEAIYTQCTPGDNTWALNADEIELDNESGMGVARNTSLRIKDVPVFYTPYLTFPVDDRRMSGFLWPSIGSADNGGLDIATPYYFNLAPNYDLTLTPRFIEDRGEMAEVEFRHLSEYGEWTLAGAELPDDKQTDTDRWLGGVQHKGQLGERWRTRIDYTRVSDDDYFDDLSITSLDIKRETHLDQRGALSYLGDEWRVDFEIERYQTISDLVDDPYQKLPELIISRRADNSNFALQPLMRVEWVDFDHRDSLKIEDDGNRITDRVTGSRLYAEPGISFPMEWSEGFIRPTAKLRHVSYNLDRQLDPDADDTPSATSALFSLDAGLFFERDLEFGGEGFVQTLEPRLYYLYSEHERQDDQPDFDTSELTFSYGQLFRDRRFSGRDRLEDFDQLSVGITSRFIEDESGNELISLSLGQIFYFDNRDVQLGNVIEDEDRHSNSAVAMELGFQPSERFWTNSSLLWDDRQDRLNEAGLLMHYRSDNDSLFNLGYRFRRISELEVTDQADASMVLPLNDRWRLFSRWNYDLERNISLEATAGVEYSSCCWQVRVLYQSAVDVIEDINGFDEVNKDNALLLEFRLKGLGGLGRKTDGLLRESIFGYEELER